MKISPIRIKPFRGPITPEDSDLEEFIKSLEPQPNKSLEDLVFELEQDVNPQIDDTAPDGPPPPMRTPIDIESLREYIAVLRSKGREES